MSATRHCASRSLTPWFSHPYAPVCPKPYAPVRTKASLSSRTHCASPIFTPLLLSQSLRLVCGPKFTPRLIESLFFSRTHCASTILTRRFFPILTPGFTSRFFPKPYAPVFANPDAPVRAKPKTLNPKPYIVPSESLRPGFCQSLRPGFSQTLRPGSGESLFILSDTLRQPNLYARVVPNPYASVREKAYFSHRHIVPTEC